MALRRRESGTFNASPDPGEVTAFNVRLKNAALQVLREQLDRPSAGRKWQRDLAQAELDRRSEEDDIDHAEKTSAVAPRKTSFKLWGVLVAGTLIAASCAIILYTAYVVWNR